MMELGARRGYSAIGAGAAAPAEAPAATEDPEDLFSV